MKSGANLLGAIKSTLAFVPVLGLALIAAGLGMVPAGGRGVRPSIGDGLKPGS